VTAPPPEPVRPPPAEPAVVDGASVTLYPDQGRLELRGTHLGGLRLHWQAAAGAAGGEDTCLEPKPAGKLEPCTFALPRDLPADATLTLLPAAPGAAAGAPAAALRPARIVLDRLLPAASAVDLTNGVGRIPLAHPEAVASVECLQASCELTEAAIFVR